MVGINEYLYSRFPESLFEAEDNGVYINSLACGIQTTSKLNVVITGLCKNIAPVLDHTIARLYKTSSFFNSCKFVVYENDSDDGTAERLKEYASKDNQFILIQESTGHKGFDSTSKTLDRALYLSMLRNICKNLIVHLHYSCKIDYVIVIDLDLEGGWSYDGILNSFAYDLDGWSAMTANGIRYENRVTRIGDQESRVCCRLFYDIWAYRAYGCEELKADVHHPGTGSKGVSSYALERGDPPIEVFSNFNGLGIYKFENMIQCEYGAEKHENGTVDCDHPYLHKQIRNNGGSIYLNPSMITLYSPHEFSLNIERQP